MQASFRIGASFRSIDAISQNYQSSVVEKLLHASVFRTLEICESLLLDLITE
uniref:Uncharacterized protein n=1 Tax=Physcomitrium patens TaxID=3218 RepID=A0A2K1KIY3_PHYPA|nr:hypothetical protein PHYPA_007419 [Physcomitrium patens]